MIRFKKGEKPKRKVFDAHNHIGHMDGFKYYGLPEPVNPTIFCDDDRASKIALMDSLGVERAVVMSNYGIPVPTQPFGLNPVVLEACAKPDKRIIGGIWFSPSIKMKEANEEALKFAGETGVKVLKATCLLGGTWNPEEWDEETKAMWENILAVAEKHDHVLHLHTSPGGGSDVTNGIKFVRAHGKRVKVHIVHCGGGVSGHIKFIPEFFQLIKEGYKVYTDTSWAVGFCNRYLFEEMEKQGVGEDRVLFCSDEPWSDFWSEYYKFEGLGLSEELKNKIFYENAEKLYGV
ncbi:MAG: amidohydrolase [Desulfovibrio sp.]|jgi:predicted TIM-barrel fold metal-dependent hydrolase|nr:amidohydrolase [Desulfovibrio sp.]